MPNPGLSATEADKILRLRRDGLTYREIRDRTGHSLGRISETIQVHKLEEMEGRVDALGDEIGNLEDMKAQLVDEVDRMRDEAEATTAAIDAVGTLRDAGVDPSDAARVAELIESGQRVGYDPEALVDLLRARNRLQSSVEELAARRDRLDDQLGKRRQRRDRLDRAVRELDQQRSRLQKQVTSLRDQAREAAGFSGSWSDAVERLQKVRDEVDRLETRAGRIRERVGTARSLDGAIAQLRDRKDRLVEDVARLDDVYEQAYREINVGLGVYRLVFESFPDGFAGLVHLHWAGRLGGGLLDGNDPRLVAAPAEEIRSTIRELLAEEVDAGADEDEWLAVLAAMGAG